MADGTVARKTGTVSEFGSKLDTAADFVLIVVSLIKLIPVICVPTWLIIRIIVIAVIKGINLISGYVVRKRIVVLHTVMNKITGIVLFVLPLTLMVIDLKYSGAVVSTVATFAAIQEGHLIRTGEQTRMSKKDDIQIREEHISAEEYIDFLKRTDLGSQYPKERFEERIKNLVQNVSISLIARNEAGLVVGALFGLTDYCYWLFVTDLGVDRDYERQGIASRLMKTAHETAGGEKSIAVYLIANENAVPFYEKIGMKKADDVMQYNHVEWTEWTV